MERDKLGKAIKERRKKLKITGERLAKRVGIDRTYISRIERHGWLPALKTMRRIAEELKSPQLLYKYIQEKYPEIEKILSEKFIVIPNRRKKQKSQK